MIRPVRVIHGPVLSPRPAGTEIAPCRRKAENLKFDKAAGSYFLHVQTNKGLADDRKEKEVSPTGETLSKSAISLLAHILKPGGSPHSR